MITEAFVGQLNANIGKYSYDFNTPETERKQAFYLSVVYNFMYEYGRNLLLTPYSFQAAGRRTYDELRAYAASKQSTDKYKRRLVFPKGKNAFLGQIETYRNISWETVAILPKLMDIVVNNVSSIQFANKINAIDSKSIGDKEYQRALNRLLLAPEIKEFVAKMQEAGAKVTMQSAFASMEEMDTYEAAVGYQILPEIALQDALLKSNIDSKYEELFRQVIRDLVVCGIGGTLDYTEESSGTPSYKYVDPKYVVADNSNYSDCRDIMRAGHFEMMTIGQIRREGNLSDDMLETIAKQYAGAWDNPAYIAANNQDGAIEQFKQRFGYQKIYDYRIPVFHMRFIGTEKEGDYTHEYVYKVSWLVNSKTVFNFGRDSFQPKRGVEGNKRTMLPYHFYKQNDSAVERVCALVDDICENEYQIRNLRSRTIPAPGVLFEEETMNSVNVGGEIFTIRDNMKAIYEAGFGVFRRKDQFNNVNGAGQSPIIPIPDASFEKIQAFAMDSMNKIALIKDILGINDYVDASNPQPRVGLGIANMARESAFNSMKGYIFSLKSIYEDTMNGLLYRWQYVVNEKGKYKGVLNAFSEQKVKVLELTSDICLRQFGIYVTIAPTDEELGRIRADLIQLRNVRLVSGAGGLTASQYLICDNMLTQRKTAECIWTMGQFEELNRKKDRESQQANVADTANMQAQASAQANEAKMREIGMEIQGKLAEIQEKNKGDLKETIIDGLVKMGLLNSKQEFLALMNQQEQQAGGVPKSTATRSLSADVQNPS